MASCWGCHRFVDKDETNIKLVLAAYEERHSLEWNRVHRAPDHVYFAHAPHVVGGVTCRECHGDVGAMETVHQVSTLTMGWCVRCHDERHAPLDCLTCHK